ncbi:DUF4956 domain-containing protein [Algibacter aquimarinus]|uniref:DUF4956 domain-containing protein n=1 Tax=Algibacter aquimarinus TaxID=1136748 RepID=A0ABP9HR33_9FLAO
MDKHKTFEEFLLSGSAQFSILNFSFNLLLTAVFAYVLSLLYNRYGSSLSNRKSFGKNFIFLAVTTMIIITIVKSSLALSLGLVGALSIVRFRTAIKEPEELTFLFLNIALGLGFGADQKAATIIGFVFLILFLISKRILYKNSISESQNLILILKINNPSKNILVEILVILKEYCDKVDIKRFDEENSIMEASFIIELENLEKLNAVSSNLKDSFKDISISFIDNNINV